MNNTVLIKYFVFNFGCCYLFACFLDVICNLEAGINGNV